MCRLLTKDFPDGLQWKEIKLVASEGAGKASRIKRSCPLPSSIYRTVRYYGLKKWEDSFRFILVEKFG